MTHAIDVSVISACRNEAGCIRAFVDSLLAQEFATYTWELIIADGMSDDGTRQILSQYESSVAHLRVIDNPRQIVSTGLNAAIAAASGRIIIRVDAHTRYASDYCLRSLEALERTGADNVGGPARTETRGRRARAIAAAYHSRFSTGGARFHDPDYAGYADTVPYGCWRREVFDRIGGFDEELVRNQDDEFNLRLLRSGGTIWQDPTIRSWYSPRSSFSALFRQYFQYGYWKVAVIRKHRLPASWRHLVPVAFVLSHAAALCAIALLAAIGYAGPAAALAAGWGIYAAAYLTAVVAASIQAARRHGWDLLAELNVAFLTFHCSYGLGFFSGLLHAGRSARAASADSVYARITR